MCKPTIEELRKVAQYLSDIGLYHAAGVLLKKAAQLEEAGLKQVP